jgi:hypothetical protein
MDTGSCELCNEKKCAGGRYNFACRGCRERVLMDEPCKLMRKSLAASIILWGELPDWKREPSCGCLGGCRRQKTMREMDTHLRNIGQRK